MSLRATGLTLLLLLARGASACDGLEVQSGWVRESPPGAAMTAAYATLANRSNKALVLQRLSSPQFGDVDLHRSLIDDGVSQMRPALPLTLEPGAVQRLEPGGYHLMLSDPRRDLHAGDAVVIRFECGKKAVQAPFTVKGGAP